MERIRGKEATIRLQIDAQPATGSFLKTKDFTLTPRQEVVETDFLGEPETDLDFMHHGYDFSFSAHVVDRQTIDFLQNIVDRDRSGLSYPRLTLNVVFAFRLAGIRAKALVLPKVIMKVNEIGFSDRKEYITQSFEGKGKKIIFRDA